MFQKRIPNEQYRSNKRVVRFSSLKYDLDSQDFNAKISSLVRTQTP